MSDVSSAQREFLEFAYLAPTKGWDGVFPRRGQHAMVNTLARLGFLRSLGGGVDVNAESMDGRDVELFVITDKGCRAIGVALRGGGQ